MRRAGASRPAAAGAAACLAVAALGAAQLGPLARRRRLRCRLLRLLGRSLIRVQSRKGRPARLLCSNLLRDKSKG